MNKSKIEWCDYTANPVKGLCPVGCEYCYARRIYKRFGWDETIRYDAKAFDGIDKIHKPSRIFVGSTIDLFCDEVPFDWITKIFDKICSNEKHTFILLTKRPERMLEYSKLWQDTLYKALAINGVVEYPPFMPIKNLWLGVTVTNQKDADERIPILLDIPAAVRFVSVEPLLDEVNIEVYIDNLDQVVVGGLSPKSVHLESWVVNIINTCTAYGVPVFIKENTGWKGTKFRQYPKEVN